MKFILPILPKILATSLEEVKKEVQIDYDAKIAKIGPTNREIIGIRAIIRKK